MPTVNSPQPPMGIFIPATEFIFPNGTWTLTRTAAGNYYYLKTAGAATTNPAVNISKAIHRLFPVFSAGLVSPNVPQGAEVQEGGLFTGFDLIYSIATANLTSLTPLLYEVAYANNVAPAVTSPGGAIVTYPTAGATIPIAIQTNPYNALFALSTPYDICQNQNATDDWIEIAVVDPGTSVFGLYGIALKFQANH